MSAVAHIKDVINRFVQNGTANKRRKTPGRLPKSGEAVGD
jgi:hypothetical protein